MSSSPRSQTGGSDDAARDLFSPPNGEDHTNGTGGPGPSRENGTPTSSTILDGVQVDIVTRRLLSEGVIGAQLVREAQESRSGDGPLWRAIAQMDEIGREDVYPIAAREYAFAQVETEIKDVSLDTVWDLIEPFSEAQEEGLVELGTVPFRVEDGCTIFACEDPMRSEARKFPLKLPVEDFELRYAPKAFVSELLEQTILYENEYLRRLRSDASVDLGETIEEEEQDLVDEEELEEQISQSTLINLFEASLVEAVRKGASDIHIRPTPDRDVEFKFRKNGRLRHWHTEDRMRPESVLSVIKDNAINIDRFETDAAQDGSIQRTIDEAEIRFRVSVMPLVNSEQQYTDESIVIRVLDDRKVITDLGSLGLGERALGRFNDAINQPYGMVILTGPTGSGKSTTLVAALHRVMGPEENVLTIEDPVEYVIDGATQIKLSDKLQLEDALRSVLRHDPDTVMVGEMRDKITAELAIKLANTGHLTFSTLHTNDAPSAVTRLYKMDIEPFLIGYAINLIVAQRLIRRLCSTCRRRIPNPDIVKLRGLGFEKEALEERTLYEAGSGCSECGGTGYEGRRAIAEALYLTKPIRHMIVESGDAVDESSIREYAEEEEGMVSLQGSARQAVLNGETSVEEMRRVVAS